MSIAQQLRERFGIVKNATTKAASSVSGFVSNTVDKAKTKVSGLFAQPAAASTDKKTTPIADSLRAQFKISTPAPKAPEKKPVAQVFNNTLKDAPTLADSLRAKFGVQKPAETPGVKALTPRVPDRIATSATENIPVPTPEQLKKPKIKQLFEKARESARIADEKNVAPVRASDLPSVPRAAVDVGTGVLGVAEGALGALEWAGADKVKPLRQKAEQWRADMSALDPTFADQLAAGVGSASAFFVPGLGAARLATIVGAISPTVASFVGAGVGGFLESSIEAGSVFNTATNEGKTEEEARSAANKTFAANILLNVITNKLGIYGEEQTSALKRVLLSAPIEGLQEYMQQVISNVNTGKDPFEGAVQSGVLGTILGGGMSAITPHGVTGVLPTVTEVVDKINKLQAEGKISVGLSMRDVTKGQGESQDEDSLVTEARKYKSAEEFVKAQSEPLYHRTDANFGSFDVSKKKGMSIGVHFFDDAKIVSDPFYEKKFGKKIIEGYPQGKIADLNPRVLPDDIKDAGKYTGEALKKYLEERGYIGVKVGNEVAVFDSKNVLTKSQLTDIWKKATAPEASKTTQDVPNVSETSIQPTTPETPQETQESQPGLKREDVPVNLVRDIAQSKDPGEILDRLKLQFPKMSEGVLTAMSQRLRNMTRESDIRGLLEIVNTVSSRTRDLVQTIRNGGTPKASPSLRGLSEEAILERLPPGLHSIGDIVRANHLSTEDIDSYVESITKSIKSQENAVLAQHEYELLWEYADQSLIDRFNELSIERELLRETVSLDPARAFRKYYGSLDPDDLSLKQLMENASKAGRPTARALEDAVSEAGYASFDEAQTGFDMYRKLRQKLADLDEEYRELKPKVRAARFLRDMGDAVPVVAKEKVGAIDALTTHDKVVNHYVDISGMAGGFRDLFRNFKQFFGDDFSKAQEAILDPFDKSKGEMVDTLKQLGDELEEGVTKKYGIKRGSKESAAIQLYGEGKINEEQLVEMVGSDRVSAVRQAEAWFRQTYARLIKEVNEVRAKIYPNDATKLVAMRKDYFRHFTELSEGFEGLMQILFGPGRIGIDPQLAGLSEFTQPKSKFLSFAQQRTGDGTEIDAVGGFLNYAPSFAYAKHIDPNIPNFRYLRRKLADVAIKPGEKVDGQILEGVNNFLEYLDDFANKLASKTNSVDRYVQKRVPGGRKTLRVVDWISNRIKANVLLGNFGSSVAQLFNVPQGVASAKQYTLHGIARTLASTVHGNEPMSHSTFIKERFADNIADRFDIDWVAHPVRRAGQAAKVPAKWLFSVFDEIGTKFIWNAHYAKALGEGMENPVKYADNETRALVAGRGIGEVPLDQEGSLFKLIAPFQVEVGNAWWVLKDFVDKKDFGAIVIMFIANFLMNEAAERIRGSRVVFDPINSMIDGIHILNEEWGAGNKDRAVVKFLGRQVGEIVSNVPLGQTFAAAIPDKTVQSLTKFVTGIGPGEGVSIDKKELFGQGDPGRFGGGLLVVSGIEDPLFKLLLPFGGAQVKKTLEGLKSMIAGEVKDKGGKLAYEVSRDPVNIFKAVVFGKYATAEAREYFDKRDDLFQIIYRQDADREELTFEGEKKWKEIKELGKKDKAAGVAALKDLSKTDPELAKKVVDIAKADKLGLTGVHRLISMLGVANGERATYIVGELRGMDTKEEKVAFMKDLESKKLISKDVLAQIAYLLQKQKEEGKTDEVTGD